MTNPTTFHQKLWNLDWVLALGVNAPNQSAAETQLPQEWILIHTSLHSPPEKPNKRTRFFFRLFQPPNFWNCAVHHQNCIRLYIVFAFSFCFLVGENFHFYFRCGSMSNCSVPVSSAVFEDACPDTHKYIEVHYKCMLGWSSNLIHKSMRSVSCRHVSHVSIQSRLLPFYFSIIMPIASLLFFIPFPVLWTRKLVAWAS